MSHSFRKIRYFDTKKEKTIIFLSNDLENDAQTIADIDKSR